MLGLSLQFFAVLAIAITLILIAYAAYVRIRSTTYTERRFQFVALWACTSVVTLAALSLADIQLLSIALKGIGINVQITTWPEKALIVVLAGSYCYLIKDWALKWNGLWTEEGKKSLDRGIAYGVVSGGVKETIRILTQKPAPKLNRQSAAESRRLALTSPLHELPFHEQVRLLVVAKWPEYFIAEDAWIGSAACWLGSDRAFNRPILVACGIHSDDFDFDALAELADFQVTANGIRILYVFQENSSYDRVRESLAGDKREVQFISFEDLTRVVANFDSYRHFIELEFKRKRLPDADFAIADILAPTRVQIGSKELKAASPNQGEVVNSVDFDAYIADWLRETSNRQIALLGEYGQGKSTAALALTYNLLFSPRLAHEYGNRVPILIRLTGRSPSTARLGEMLGAWGTPYNLTGQVLLALHRAGRLLLIFDAFDEMANVMDRTARFEHFDALWEFASHGAKILFTGRPNFFLDDEELKEVLGINKGAAIGPYCEAIRIAPFDMDQIETAIGWLTPEKRDVLVSTARHSPALLEVCCRPSLLYLIAHLWNKGRLDLISKGVNSATIIREFISYSLERQVQKQKDEEASKRPERQFINLTKSELEYFTSGIAVAVLTDGRQNSIAKDLFELRIGDLYGRMSSLPLPPGKDEVGGLAVPIRERFADHQNPIETCVNAVRTHGVIEHDFTRSRHYRFSHKSFAEVLAAEMLANKLLCNDDISAAIEQANSTYLADLAVQPQIVEFMAEFLTGNSSEARKLSYADIYNRIFPAHISLGIWNRFKSVMSAGMFLIGSHRMIRLTFLASYGLVFWLAGAYVMEFFRPGIVFRVLIITFGLSERGEYVLEIMGLISLVLAPVMFVSLRNRPGLGPKLALIGHLCDVLEAKGHKLKRSFIERYAHDRAIVETLGALRKELRGAP